MAIANEPARLTVGSFSNTALDSIFDRVDRRIAEKLDQRKAIKSRGVFGLVPSVADFRRLIALDLEISALKQVKNKALQLKLEGKDLGPNQLRVFIDNNPKLRSIGWLASIDQVSPSTAFSSGQADSFSPHEQTLSMNRVGRTSSDTLSPPGFFEGLLLVKAIQLAEREQPLDDASAMKDAHYQYTHPRDRLVRRAVLMAPQVGFDQELTQWRERLRWVCVGSALSVATLSYGLVNAVVGGDRQINALAALVAVLGPHMLFLTVWLLALAFGSSGGGLLKSVLVASTHIPGFKRRSTQLCLNAGLDVDFAYKRSQHFGPILSHWFKDKFAC